MAQDLPKFQCRAEYILRRRHLMGFHKTEPSGDIGLDQLHILVLHMVLPLKALQATQHHYKAGIKIGASTTLPSCIFIIASAHIVVSMTVPLTTISICGLPCTQHEKYLQNKWEHFEQYKFIPFV